MAPGRCAGVSSRPMLNLLLRVQSQGHRVPDQKLSQLPLVPLLTKNPEDPLKNQMLQALSPLPQTKKPTRVFEVGSRRNGMHQGQTPEKECMERIAIF